MCAIRFSLAILETCGLLPPEYTAKNAVLFKHYYPIEINHDLPYPFKCEKMTEWYIASCLLPSRFVCVLTGVCVRSVSVRWSKANALQVEFGVNRQHLAPSVAQCLAATNPKSCLAIRQRIPELFSLMSTHHIPVLVYTAGVSDIVQEVLEQSGNWWAANMHVLGNKMVFDEKTGQLIKFAPLMIHALNKSEFCMGFSMRLLFLCCRHLTLPSLSLYVCMYVCVYVCVPVYVHTYIHTYTARHRL